uniref:Uncharacterized protein n=1 Tax=Opuntia streptacantha TaxID=393608 RepID=A0A7C9D5S1_OPUST
MHWVAGPRRVLSSIQHSTNFFSRDQNPDLCFSLLAFSRLSGEASAAPFALLGLSRQSPAARLTSTIPQTPTPTCRSRRLLHRFPLPCLAALPFVLLCPSNPACRLDVRHPHLRHFRAPLPPQSPLSSFPPP